MPPIMMDNKIRAIPNGKPLLYASQSLITGRTKTTEIARQIKEAKGKNQALAFISDMYL
jgi:hypothetical protein